MSWKYLPNRQRYSSPAVRIYPNSVQLNQSAREALGIVANDRVAVLIDDDNPRRFAFQKSDDDRGSRLSGTGSFSARALSVRLDEYPARLTLDIEDGLLVGEIPA